MPSEQQFVELGRLVREARSWFNRHQAANSEALGEAIVLTQTMLRRWAEPYVFERLGRGLCEVEDLLSQAAEQIIDKFSSVIALTGKEFYKLMKRMVERFVHDRERRRHAFRRARGGDLLSLERDAQAARLAELLVDEQPTPEALAILAELKGEVRRFAQAAGVRRAAGGANDPARNPPGADHRDARPEDARSLAERPLAPARGARPLGARGACRVKRPRPAI